MENKELIEAMRTVITYLDKQMQEAPSRAMADASNLLEDEIVTLGGEEG